MTLERPRPIPRLDLIERQAARFPELDLEGMHTYLEVRKLAMRLDDALDVHLARHQMSFARFMVLVNLLGAEGHSLTPAHLSEGCGVTRATMTGVIDTLEKSGLVERQPDPDDGRSTIVRLSITGRRFLEKMLPDHFTRLAKMMSVLSHAEMRTLRGLLGKLFDGAEALEADATPTSARRTTRAGSFGP